MRLVSLVLVVFLLVGCASSGSKSVTGFGSALGHGMVIKQGTALSTSLSNFAMGFGILEGIIYGLAAIKENNIKTVDLQTPVSSANCCDSSEPTVQPIGDNAGVASPPNSGSEEPVTPEEGDKEDSMPLEEKN